MPIQPSPIYLQTHSVLSPVLDRLERSRSVQKFLKKAQSAGHLAAGDVVHHPAESPVDAQASASAGATAAATAHHGAESGAQSKPVLVTDQSPAPQPGAADKLDPTADGRFRLSEGFKKRLIGSLVFTLQAMLFIYGRKMMGSMITWDAPKSLFK